LAALKILAASCEESSIPNKDFSIFLLAYPAASSGECARGDSIAAASNAPEDVNRAYGGVFIAIGSVPIGLAGMTIWGINETPSQYPIAKSLYPRIQRFNGFKLLHVAENEKHSKELNKKSGSSHRGIKPFFNSEIF